MDPGHCGPRIWDLSPSVSAAWIKLAVPRSSAARSSLGSRWYHEPWGRHGAGMQVSVCVTPARPRACAATPRASQRVAPGLDVTSQLGGAAAHFVQFRSRWMLTACFIFLADSPFDRYHCLAWTVKSHLAPYCRSTVNLHEIVDTLTLALDSLSFPPRPLLSP